MPDFLLKANALAHSFTRGKYVVSDISFELTGGQTIGIAGANGTGKSTLVKLLAERLNWEPVFEAVEENPYLADFYQDMQRWSFHSQVFSLQ